MADKLKTVLLAVLVALSLLQSYLLIYDRPENRPLNRTEYVRTELRGLQADVQDLLFPVDMVIHFGNNEHALLYPNSTFFELILRMLKGKTFEGLTAERPFIQDFGSMRREMIGIELRYMTPVPLRLTMLDQAFPPDRFGETTRVRKLWFYQQPNQAAVKLMLFTEDGVYEVAQNAVLPDDLRQYVLFGQFLQPRFETEDGELYVPAGPIQLGDLVEVGYGMFSSDQLRNSLFADPSISRSILQQDGTEMITDGKRGLQIDYTRMWMSFNDPIAITDQVRQADDLAAALASAVQFVNQHGGWNGKYVLSGFEHGEWASHEFRFTQLYDGIPVIAAEGTPLGTIRVATRQGLVTEYERSLVNLNIASLRRFRYELPGGEKLKAQLERTGRERIAALFPSYVPIFEETHVELLPRWAVRLKTGGIAILGWGG